MKIGSRVGVLGGGQLARMLCIEGFKMGFEMHVLSSADNDPAAQVTRHWHQGDLNNVQDVKKFLAAVDIATFESEFLSEKVLLDAQATTNIELQPRIHLITELSDRLKQKAWLERFQIPTSPFAGLLTTSDVYTFINRRTKAANRSSKHHPIAVFKKRRMGYDGYGTFIIRDKKHLLKWLAENEKHLSQYIIEDYQPFKRELAVQFAVNRQGEVLTFPLVEWQAENSRCLWVKGPAITKFKSMYKKILKQLIHALVESHYVGVIAFELFETSRGLIINEVAPRVHNSAHYTLDTLSMNQFKAHLYAVAGLPLPQKISLLNKGFAMVNILADKNLPGQNNAPIDFKTDVTDQNNVTSNAFIHWYGKNEYREGRKMGHLTVLCNSRERALKEALRLRKMLTRC